MARRPAPDPRTLSPSPAEESVTPVVALPRQGLPKPVLIAFAVAAAVILFVILESRRRSVEVPSEIAPQASADAPSPAPAPPLVVPQQQQLFPQQYQPQPQLAVPQSYAPGQRVQSPAAPPLPRQPQIVYVPQPGPQAAADAPAPAPVRVAGGAALVIDTTGAQGPAAAAAGAEGDAGAASGGVPAAITGSRSRAGVLANRSTTVAQGT